MNSLLLGWCDAEKMQLKLYKFSLERYWVPINQMLYPGMGLLNKPSLIWARAEQQDHSGRGCLPLSLPICTGGAGKALSERSLTHLPSLGANTSISTTERPNHRAWHHSPLLSWEFHPPKTPVTPHNAPCSESQPICCPEASPDLHAYAVDSESSWEHPGLEGPQTHLQHPVEMENFQTFTKAWSALAGEEDLGQLPNSPKASTAALIISS